MIDLQRDCGAPGNGLSANAALELAYKKVQAGVSNVIHIEGHHGLFQGFQTAVDFIDQSNGLILQGDGSNSVLEPQHIGPYNFALRYGNLQSFSCRDLYLASTSQDKKVDCGPVMLVSARDVHLFNTHLVGLAGDVIPEFGLLYLHNSDSTLEHCSFIGCGAGTKAGKASIVTVTQEIGFRANHVRFIDFGMLNKNRELSKTSHTGGRAWITFNGKALGNDDHGVRQGMYGGAVALIENSFFDEGAGTAIEYAHDPKGPRARGLIVKQTGINVNGIGVYAQHADFLYLEDVFFAWCITPKSKAVLTKGVKRVHLKRCKTVCAARTVEALDVESVILEDCEGFDTSLIPREKLTIL